MGDKLIRIFVFLFGIVIGSFINILAYKLPNNVKIFHGKVTCTKCQKEIKYYELIPVFSYILQKGKYNCGHKIPISNLIIELFTGFIYLVTYSVFGNSIEALVYLIIFPILIGIIRIDYEHYYIPDRFNLTIFIVGLMYAVYLSFTDIHLLLDRLIGLVVGFLLVFIVRLIGKLIYKREAMGLGDLKFLMAFGMVIGYIGVIFTFIVGCVLASIIELTLMTFKIKKRGKEIAFGPYLVYASMIYIFIGNSVIEWYLRLLGGYLYAYLQL